MHAGWSQRHLVQLVKLWAHTRKRVEDPNANNYLLLSFIKLTISLCETIGSYFMSALKIMSVCAIKYIYRPLSSKTRICGEKSILRVDSRWSQHRSIGRWNRLTIDRCAMRNVLSVHSIDMSTNAEFGLFHAVSVGFKLELVDYWRLCILCLAVVRSNVEYKTFCTRSNASCEWRTQLLWLIISQFSAESAAHWPVR